MKNLFSFLVFAVPAALITPSMAHETPNNEPESLAPTKALSDSKAFGETPFGYATPGSSNLTKIIIEAGKTNHIRVVRLESYRIINGTRTLDWTFDTLGLPSFPLSKIFSNSPNVMVYVEENPMYAN